MGNEADELASLDAYYREDHRKTDVFRENQRRYESQRARDQRAFVDELKDVPCADCGGRFPACAMDFDHVRGEKRLNVARMSLYSREVILDEIAKCDVVCANCHRVRTYSRRAVEV